MNQAFNSNKVVPDSTNLMPRNTEPAKEVEPQIIIDQQDCQRQPSSELAKI